MVSRVERRKKCGETHHSNCLSFDIRFCHRQMKVNKFRKKKLLEMPSKVKRARTRYVYEQNMTIRLPTKWAYQWNIKSRIRIKHIHTNLAQRMVPFWISSELVSWRRCIYAWIFCSRFSTQKILNLTSFL